MPEVDVNVLWKYDKYKREQTIKTAIGLDARVKQKKKTSNMYKRNY